MEKPEVRIVSAVVTDKGLSNKRPVNEDFYLEMPEHGLFAVADGVGGAQAGDFASQTAMEVVHEAFSNPQQKFDTEELLEMAITRANASIYQMSHELPQFEMMATTIVTLHLDGNIATIGHVGDSRLYRLDGSGKLFRETGDHSMVEEEVRAGRMTATQAANHPSRNVISRALGADATVEVEMRTIMFDPGTTFMLCSDGVTRHLEDNEIREVLGRPVPPSEICGEIKSICYSRGAEDNLTAIVIRVEDKNAPIIVVDGDEETTITGTRPVFAPDPLTALSNGIQQQQRGADSVEARTDEFAAMNVVHPDAPTAPLEPLSPNTIEADTQVTLKPASQTIGVTDTPVDPAAYQPTLEQKTGNERIRAKIDAAQPFSEYSESEQNSGGLSKLFSSLALLILGVLIGAGGYYAWMLASPPPTAAPTVQPANTVAPLNSNSDLSPQEINEFRMFERVRRTVDESPRAAQNRFPEPATAADYYLRGRAFLLLGEYQNARGDFSKAAELLSQSNEVNQATLRTDIVVGQAAIGAVTLTASDRKMLEELVKSKQNGGSVPTNSEPINPVR